MVSIRDGQLYSGTQAINSELTRTDGSESQSVPERNAVLIASTDGIITDVNVTFLDLFETAEAEAIGSPLETYLPERDTDDGRAYFEGFSCGLTVQTECGVSRSFRFRTVPFTFDGEQRILGIYTEETERRQEEVRSRLLTDLSHEIAKADTTVAALEKTVETICTYTEWRYGEVWQPAESGTHLTFTTGYSTDSPTAKFLEESRSVTFAFGAGLPGRVYQSHRPEWISDASAEPTDVFHRTKLATEAGLRAAFAVPIIVDHSVVAVLSFFLGNRRAEDGRLASDIQAVVSNLEGLIKRKQVEEKLKRQNERLDTFTSTVTHDLRNPLSVAQGYLELAKTENSQKPLDNVSDALDRMDTLIHNLLTLSREGKIIGEQRSISLVETATNAWENVETQTATLDVTDGGLLADPVRTQQLFENLFRNSVEHGGDDVTVRVGPLYPVETSTRTDGTVVGFYVEDTGPGVPAEKRESVFSNTDSMGGTGLGLVTVREIASAHGWESRCTAGQDGGAKFEFEYSGVTDATEQSQLEERQTDPRPIETLSLPEIVESVQRRQTQLVLSDSQVPDQIASRLATNTAGQHVEVVRTVSSDAPAVAGELTVGNTVLATFSQDRLQELASTDADSTSSETVQPLLNTVVRQDTDSMTAISKEIEDRAYRVGGGTLYVGFQSAENFDDQRKRYDRLANAGITVHTFAVSESETTDTDGVTHHTDPSSEVGRTWFLVYDGDGDPWHKSALIATETEPDRFTGFWTDTPEIVDGVIRSLLCRFDSLGA